MPELTKFQLDLLQQIQETNAEVRRLNEKQELQNQQLATMNELLSGNGSPEKGMVLRLDRLEQNESRRTWLMRSTVASCVGAIITILASWFKK